MPANFQRYMPLLLIGVVLLFILPALFKKHSTSGPNAATRATTTLAAMDLIDRGEQDYRTAHGRFTSHLADLVTTESKLAADLSIGLGVQLDVSTDGATYVAQVESDVLGLVRARTKAKVIERSCLVLKSGSGVTCTPKK